jgi:fatty acid desaturase
MKRQEMVFDPFQLLGKRDRKQLTRRNDWIGLSYLGTHLGAIGVSGTGIYLTAGTLFMIPMMFVHGILLACLFAPMHECSHGTAFRTRWLNEAVYWFVSLIYIIQPTWYRYRHAVHHTYTQIQGMDPAMVLPSPTTWRHYCEQLLGWRLWTTFPVVITKHALGRMRPQDSWYVPKQDLPRIYGEARIMLVVYGTVAGLAVFFGSFAPLIYWIIPRILGEPLQRAWRIAEHKGCDEGPDVRTNTRSTRTGAIMRRLCWNMPYHSEHHVCPQVPFFALPELNRLVGNELKPMGDSLWAVDKDVRRTCIVSEAEAASILEERKRKKESVDESWLCHLD